MIIKKIKILVNRILKKVDPKREITYLKLKGLKAGDNVDIIKSWIDCKYCNLIEIGNDVTITHATILAHDASMKKIIGKSKVSNVKIGSRVFIGFNSIVLCGVTIGDDVIIGAGTIVSKDIPSNSVVVGNPAKIIGTTKDFINKNIKHLEDYNELINNEEINVINMENVKFVN